MIGQVCEGDHVWSCLLNRLFRRKVSQMWTTERRLFDGCLRSPLWALWFSECHPPFPLLWDGVTARPSAKMWASLLLSSFIQLRDVPHWEYPLSPLSSIPSFTLSPLPSCHLRSSLSLCDQLLAFCPCLFVSCSLSSTSCFISHRPRSHPFPYSLLFALRFLRLLLDFH